MIIRPAKPNEFEQVAKLALESFGNSVAPHYSQEGVETFARYCNADALQSRSNEDHQTIVAIEKREIVGMAHVREGKHIAMLFVSTDRQRTGIGRRLLAYLFDRSPNSAMTLNASPNSIAAYAHIGFEALGQEIQTKGIRYVPMSIKVGSSHGAQNTAANVGPPSHHDY